MKIAALDIATTCGFCFGDAGTIPQSGSVRLKRPGEPPEVAAFNMRAFLRDRFTLERFDLLVLEHYLHPIAQKSGDAVILQLMCFGVAVAEGMARGMRIEMPKPATIRAHFIGRANMGERKATKAAVLQRAKVLGYVPRECRDEDRADACAAFDWGSATIAHAQPRNLVLFGEGAAS